MSGRREQQLQLNGVPARWVADYAAASGDDNPLHELDDGGNGVVQGMLVAALLERYALEAYPNETLLEMTVRFTSPVLIDQPLTLRLREGPSRDLDGQRIRKVRGLVESAGRLALIAECMFQLPEEGSTG